MRAMPGVRAAIASLFLVAGGVPFAHAQVAGEAATVPARRVILQDGFDLPGGDLQQLFDTTLQACVATCLADSACTAMTYNTRARSCFPKGQGTGAPAAFPGALSGRIADTAPAVIDAAKARAASASGWLSAQDVAQAREQAERIGSDYPGTGEPVEALRAHATDAANANNPLQVIRWIGAATAVSDTPADWLSLAQWMAASANAEGGTDEQAASAMNAAVNGWLRDSGAGSLAIRTWAEMAEKRDRGQDGLRALRQAAETDPDPALAAMVDRFADRYGFRMQDTSVEADAPQPRACVQMSEPVATDTDLRSFVTLPDQSLAVEAEGFRVCVTGVTHGQTLNLTLRKGLPAKSREVLARDIPVSLYIRDRTPQARFTGRAYLLPAGGDQGLTVRTVNTDKVALVLYSVSDRNLVQTLRERIFGQPLGQAGGALYESDLGEDIWAGEADVAPSPDGAPRKVNEEVATRLDVAKAAGPLPPGVYALTASVPGQDEDRSPAATQWFMISDLGMTSYSGTDGLSVAIRGLGDAAARAGVRVQLVSRGNAVIATTQTDADGIARFEAGLTRGEDAAAPAMLTATVMDGERTSDMAFLSLTDPEFDLSDRGVEGQPSPGPIDVYAKTDRGAYRAGETIHATILARDARTAGLADLPITAIIRRPDGVEAARVLVPQAGDGGYVLDWTVPGTAPRGGWTIDLKLDVEAEALASMRVLVEDFRPERLDVVPELPAAPLRTDAPFQVGLTARWLYGAPGAELPVEGEQRFAAATALPGWDGYIVGLADAGEDSGMASFPPGETDAEGRWRAELPVPDRLRDTKRPMQVSFVMSVREGAGRPVSRTEDRLVMPVDPVIGIRPMFDGLTIAENTEATFEVAAIGPDLKATAGKASWVVNRLDTDYQWYALDGDWSWESFTTRENVARGDLDLTADKPAPLGVTVGWGEYELVVTGADGAVSSTTFYAGWGAASAGSETPDRLRVTLDKPAYRAGDTAQLTMEAAADGVALVSVLSNRVVSMQAVPVKAGPNSLDLPVTDAWGAGAYVTVSAIRPLGDATAGGTGHAPIRAVGLAHAGVDPGARRLAATITAPAEVRPRGTVTVRLAVADAAPGEVVHATLAAVDQGILNLTRFTPPDPTGHYFGQQRLGVGLRDLYGRLILPSGAAAGAIRSGGSDDGAGDAAPPPTERLMAFFSGPLTVGPDGAVEVEVPLPDFNGEVRLMGMVWTASAVGQADATMLVRDPVVVTVTAPAFLAPGDSAQIGLALTQVAGPAGAVGLAAEVMPGGATLGLADLAAQVTLAEKGRGEAGLRITAPDLAADGVAQLRLSATLPGDGGTITKDLAISIRRQDPTVTRATRVTLAPGATQTIDPAALGQFRPGTGSVTLTSGAFAQLDLGAALVRLRTYPYGCTEQLASGAMPLIVLPDLARLIDARLPDAGDIGADIDDAIARILTRQSSEGAFGLWQPGSSDPWLDAFATDFLSRARAAGHPVPDEAMRRALARLQNNLNSAGDPQYGTTDENAALAYAAYVLARERAAVVSDLRYYADTAGDQFSPMAAAQLGAALASYGDVGRADAMFRRAQAKLSTPPSENAASGFRGDYGSPLRDAAAALALAAEAGSQAVDRPGTATYLADRIAARAASDASLSTQEALWIGLAGQALQTGPDAGNALSIGEAPAAGPLVDLGDPTTLAPVALRNGGSAPLDVTLSTTAVPTVPARAGGNGWTITRRYFTPEGQQADPAQVAQGTKLVVVLDVAPLAQEGGRLMVTDPLPAGFEIDNPNLIADGEIGALDWLETTETEMAEFRQDRFAAAVSQTEAAPFTLAYRIRAVSTGRFHHPAATVEDMYRPQRRGWTDSGTVEITP